MCRQRVVENEPRCREMSQGTSSFRFTSVEARIRVLAHRAPNLPGGHIEGKRMAVVAVTIRRSSADYDGQQGGGGLFIDSKTHHFTPKYDRVRLSYLLEPCAGSV